MAVSKRNAILQDRAQPLVAMSRLWALPRSLCQLWLVDLLPQ